MKIRQVLINEILAQSRKNVILCDLELKFIRNLIGKTINLPDNINIEKEIDRIQKDYDFYLEKLNYFKDMRDKNQADRVQQKVVETTPAQIKI